MTGKMDKDEKPKEGTDKLDEGSRIILQELMKHLDKCVGDRCDQMRKDLRTEIAAGKLDEAAIRKITEDLRTKLGTEVKAEFTEPIKGMNSRMTQYGLKIEKTAEVATQAADAARSATAQVLEATKRIEGISEVVKAPMGRLEELEKARLSAETSKLAAEKELAERSKAALEKAEAEKAKAPVAAPTPPPAPPAPCPNCSYDPTKGAPKVTAGCPTCHNAFTNHETDPPKGTDEKGNALGGQGYKFCPGCGSPLVPITELVKKKPQAAPKPTAPAPTPAPATPQAAAAQPKSP